MVCLINSSLLGAVNFITTIIQLRVEGADLDAAAVLCLGAICHRLSAAAGLSAAGSGRRAATDGQSAGHQLFPADGPGGLRAGAACQRRRQPVAVAAFVLVSGASGGLCADPAGHGHRDGNHRQQHAQADLGLPLDGLFRRWSSASSRSSSGRITCI